MPTENADKAQGTPFSQNFQDAVTLIEYDGKPVVIGREFGQFLEYADDGKQLVKLVIDDWSDEFLPDIDLIVLRNGRLAEFKRVCAEMGLKLVDKRAPSLLLLTKSGMELVLARTEKPQGRTFRRWLVSEAIPGYEAARRGEALPGAVGDPEIGGPSAPPSMIAPATSLDELRFRVEGLERIAASGQLDREAARALLAHAVALLVAGAGGRSGGPQLPTMAMTGGEADHEHPGLVPIPWAAQPEALIARNQRPVPGLPVELDGKTPQDLMVFFVNHHHFFSDRAWRSFARWMVDAGILHAPRWLELFNAAGKDPRVVEGPQRRGRRRPFVPEG